MMNYVLKLTDENYKTRNGFQWPTSGSVKCIDSPEATKNISYTLYGFLYGEGNIIRSQFYKKALILEVSDDYSVELNGLIKFNDANVIFAGEILDAAKELRRLVGEDKKIAFSRQDSKLNGQIQIGGNYSIFKAGMFSQQNAGDYSELYSGDMSEQKSGKKSKVIGGFKCIQDSGDMSIQISKHESKQNAGISSYQESGRRSDQIAGAFTTQKAGDCSTHTIYGNESYIIKNGKKCTLIQIFGGNTIVINLDKELKKFQNGDRIKIVEGKSFFKVDPIEGHVNIL